MEKGLTNNYIIKHIKQIVKDETIKCIGDRNNILNGIV